MPSLGLGRSHPEQLLGQHRISCDGLVHRVHVGGLLRLVRAQAARCVQDARRNVPACTRPEPIRRRQLRDVVVAGGELLERLADLLLRRSRLEAEERVREIAPVVVDLCREVDRLSGLPRAFTSAAWASSAWMCSGRAPWLSKSFEYIGRHSCSSQMRSPMSAPFSSATASRSRTVSRGPPSSTTMKLRPSLGLVSGPLSAGVVELNQRSSMPPRSAPSA